MGTVSEKLMHKLSVQAPPKLTVEKYLVEIAKYYNVDYEPDTQVSDSQYCFPVGLCAFSFILPRSLGFRFSARTRPTPPRP